MKTDWRDGPLDRSVEATPQGEGRWQVSIDGAPVDLEVDVEADGRLTVSVNGKVSTAVITVAGDRRFIRFDRLDFVVQKVTRSAGRKAGAAGGGLEAPMPGVVTKLLVESGDSVTKGQPLVALEAMKMEHMIRAPRDGVVAAILAKQGEMVDGGAPLVELEEQDDG